MATAETSLQRLQAIENGVDDLELQLKELRNIICLEESLNKQTPDTDGTLKSRYYGREERVLRWLLRKLHSSGQDEAGLRLSVAAWKTLALLVQLLPAHLAAKGLASNNFLDSLEKTLRELSGIGTAATTSQNAAKSETESHISDAANQFLSTSGNKKRPRSKMPEEKSAKRLRSTSDSVGIVTKNDEMQYQFQDIVAAIAMLLENVGRLTGRLKEGNGPNLYGISESLFTTDPEKAASILGSWLTAVHSARANHFSDEHVSDRIGGSLEAVFRIWQSRSANTSTSTRASRAAFSNHCLTPAAMILGDTEYPKSPTDSVKLSIRTAVEQLVARHVIMEGKATFLDTSQQQAEAAEPSKLGYPNDIADLLKPLRSSLEAQLSGDVSQISPSTSLLRNAIPQLFQIAVRCASLTTPRKRLTESPWLEKLFAELVSWPGIKVDEGMSTGDTAEAAVHFNKLLEIAKENKLKLNRAMLGELAAQRCGLKSGDQPNWTAVSYLISLDPSIFVKERSSSGPKNSAGSAALDDLLFTTISDRVWLSAESFQQVALHEKDSEYHRVAKHVIRPLMRAYANGRDTIGFLNQWYSGLVTLSQNDNQPSNFSVWDDLSLHQALEELLESSMTSTQISKLVEERYADIRIDTQAKDQHTAFHKASASSVLLTAILDGIRSDESKAMVLATAFNIMMEALRLLSRDDIRDLPHRSRLWTLVGSSHRFWSAIVPRDITSDLSEYNATFIELLTKGVEPIASKIKRSKKKGASTDLTEAIDALACVGSILVDTEMRHWATNEIQNLSRSLIERIFVKTTDREVRSDPVDAQFYGVIAHYPMLLHMEGERATNLKEKLLLQMAHLNVSMNARSTEAEVASRQPPWPHLISRSMEDASWLLGDIKRNVSVLKNVSTTENGKTSGFSPEQQLSYLQIPSANFPRNERREIITGLTETMKTSGLGFKVADWSRTLSLLVHMMNVLTDVAGLGVQFMDVLAIADIIDTSLTAGETPAKSRHDILTIFGKFVEQSLRHDVQVAGRDGTEACLEKAATQTVESSGSQTLRPCRLEILSTALRILSALTVGTLGHSVVAKDTQMELCRLVCEQFDHVWKRFESTKDGRELLLDNLAYQVTVLTHIHEEALRKHQFAVHGVNTIIERILEGAKETSMQPRESTNLLAVLNYKLGWKLGAQGTESLELSPLYELLQDKFLPESQALLLRFFVDAFLKFPEEDRVVKLRDLLEDCQSSDPDHCTSRFQLLHALVSSSGSKVKSKIYKDLIPASEIPSVLAVLSSNLPGSSTFRDFHLLVSSITVLLRNSPKGVTQPAIESVLLATTLCFSQTSPIRTTIAAAYGPKIYMSLATIMRTLLTQHRLRLRGRFDILVAALQAFLRELFIIPGISSKNSVVATHARSQLPKASQPQNWRLSAQHAEAFTRLVTLLCDPSVSATTTTRMGDANSGRNVRLTDETRKARTYAGQYVPALLLTLCDLQLRGRFCGEGVRGALEQGVYAMFDVMGKDVLGATNEGIGMPGGVRTVLRQWWEAWRRERGRK